MEQFISEFGLDLRLLIAQLINFAVLVFILAKFVYKPILKVLDERRKKIEDGIAFSEKAETELANIEVKKAESLKETEKKSVELIKEAEGSAQKQKEAILISAEEDKEKVVESGKMQLQAEKRKIQESLYGEASEAVKLCLNKILTKKSFDAEEEQLIKETLEQIKSA